MLAYLEVLLFWQGFLYFPYSIIILDITTIVHYKFAVARVL